MKNSANILNYYSRTNSEYLHSKGRFATEVLLQRIDCLENEKILEIGFGTGATLVYLASIYKKNHFYGVEFSNLMYKKAKSRIHFCLLKNVSLTLNTNPIILPFTDHFFDKIYIESVLAIQENDDLNLIIGEIYRILKPEGILVLNEGIWLDSIPKEEITAINTFCKSKFGIIQSSEQYPYLSDWKLLLKKNGFTVESIESLDNIANKPQINQPLLNKVLSKTFTLFGKFKSKINPTFRKQFSEYKKEMETLSIGKQYMEGLIIKSKRMK